MTPAEKAAAFDWLLQRLSAIEVVAGEKVSGGSDQAMCARDAAAHQVLQVAFVAAQHGHRVPSLEALGAALVDLSQTGRPGAMLKAPRAGKGASPRQAAIFRGAVVATIERLRELEPGTTVKDGVTWAVKSIRAAKVSERVDSLDRPTISRVRGWWGRYRGASATECIERDAYQETLATLRSTSATDRPRTKADLAAYLKRRTTELPPKT
jgi:hypothetical protein